MKYLRILSDIMVWCVYGIILSVMAAAAPMAAGYCPMVVLSGSMEPAYPVGSLIYYKNAAFEDIQAGDVITYRIGENRSYVTHRVVEKEEQTQKFVTKGDANPTKDTDPVPYDRVVGKVSARYLRYAGYLADYVKQAEVIAVLAGILLLNIFLHYLCARKGEPAKRRERVEKGKKQ